MCPVAVTPGFPRGPRFPPLSVADCLRFFFISVRRIGKYVALHSGQRMKQPETTLQKESYHGNAIIFLMAERDQEITNHEPEALDRAAGAGGAGGPHGSVHVH